MADVRLMLGDCLELMRGMADNSVDSIVTDPPYGLSDHKPADVVACLSAWLAGEPYLTNKRGFMGKTWDSWVPGPEVWRECLRVLKPGGHVLAFAGSRTHDLMSMAMRLAGFECRDTIMYLYGSGFPKSMDVSKQLDKMAGAARDILSERANRSSFDPNSEGGGGFQRGTIQITTPATEAARQWQGWGTALKPAFEPVLMFRKPLSEGTVAANVLEHGTGALNIDGCRVAATDKTPAPVGVFVGSAIGPTGLRGERDGSADNLGRWPANICHDGSDEVLAGFPTTGPSKSGGKAGPIGYHAGGFGAVRGGHDDNGGSAARFFYCAKASKRDREEGLEGFDRVVTGAMDGNSGRSGQRTAGDGVTPIKKPVRANTHPTVKPTDLMAYLCRLVTPPNGIVLDPFMGSGSTGKAAMLEGFRFIGIEQDEKYFQIASERIAACRN